MKRCITPLLIIICLLPSLVWAWSNWNTLSTPYFKVFYQPGMEADAYNVLQTLEHYRPYVEQLTGNSVYNTTMKIEDIGNLVNGYANHGRELTDVLKHINRSVLFPTPVILWG